MALPLPLEGRGWSNSESILDIILDSYKTGFLFSFSSIYLHIFGCHTGTWGGQASFSPTLGVVE